MRRPYRRKPIDDRFWAKVDRRDADDCWLWTAALTRSGYGKIGAGGEGGGWRGAHRVAWELHSGPVPAGMYVCHRCDVPACVNPAHLFLGTNADNLDDMRRKERHRRKLSAAAVLEIRRRRESGELIKDLAHSFGIGRTQVMRVVHRQAWNWME